MRICDGCKKEVGNTFYKTTIVRAQQFLRYFEYRREHEYEFCKKCAGEISDYAYALSKLKEEQPDDQ